ncbi:N-acetylglucosaminyl transferase component [Astrocystis sublimbata]|nr:N-acetylglucosaminyl transferase component [Astrocystis sublimbata]
MHPFSVLTLAIFVAGYITARWDLVTRLYELALFAWDNGVISRLALGCAFWSTAFLLLFIPVRHIALSEADLHDGLMRVFWPSDIAASDLPGVLVGWRNSDLDVVVVAVLEHVDPMSVENALKTGILLRNARHPTSMHVIGLTNVALGTVVDPSWVQATLHSFESLPQVTCSRASSIQTILFERPNPCRMQFISLNPIALSLSDDSQSLDADPQELELEDEKPEQKQNQKVDRLVEKLKLHSVVQHPPSSKDKALSKIVNQINWAWELEHLLQKNVSLIGPRPKRTLSVSERVVEHATTMRDTAALWVWNMIIIYVFPVIRRVFIITLLAHRLIAEALISILEWRLRPSSPALKDMSATAQQVEIRLLQFCYWPMQYVKLRLRKNDWDSVTTSHPDYIRFYNSLWLVANDVIIGIALGSYIIENADWAADMINLLLSKYSITALQTSISWLMGWPAGLKLNSELALFLGDLFLWVIDYWDSCARLLEPLLPQMIWFIGFSSFAGASMPIALLSDLLSALTLHIYMFYLASARIFHWQLTILLSLFQLFRGKKYNVLRNRVDSCDYDLDQLLVGTILFTLLFFLLPTVIVFYLNFALARMVIILLKAMFDTMLSCLNHFPLFALMLRAKDPRRLPDRHRTTSTSSSSSISASPTSLIHLKPVPLEFSAMFYQYFQMGSRLRKHYLSPSVLFCLVTGRFVPPIHRKVLYSLQYSMLPPRRAGIIEIWEALNSLPAKQPVYGPAAAYKAAALNGRRHANGRGARSSR